MILATDADVDGMHIRNLMITYFFKFFEQALSTTAMFMFWKRCCSACATGKSGSAHEKTVYCYSETERDNAVNELGGKPEITRFKGLGEISPKEFAQFIGKEMRASKVEYAPRARIRADLQVSTWARTRARAEGLHHGPARRAGGGVILPLM